jgi:hypothetical protein
MKILYLSCHSVLEYDEAVLFHELGHEVFCNGAYLNPRGHYSLPRPSLPTKYYPKLAKLAREHPKTDLPREMIEWADVVVIMHTPEILTGNMKLFRELKKPVIWRSIGQSIPKIEKIVRFYRSEGLKVVRYSPKEQNIPEYAGQDTLIRFYKDPSEFKSWNGKNKQVINLTQSLKARRNFCHYEDIIELMNGFDCKVYGTGNTDLGELNGGQLTFDNMKGALRDNRVFVYGGSWPAPYTLGLMEAMMTGIPVVAIGKRTAQEIDGTSYMNFYEVNEIIEDGVSGFVSDDIEYLKDKIKLLLENDSLAHRISKAGRQRAIELFGKQKIKKQWEEFLNEI